MTAFPQRVCADVLMCMRAVRVRVLVWRVVAAGGSSQLTSQKPSLPGL